MREEPKEGQLYRHFKGNVYRIVTVALHTETGEKLVIYERNDADERPYARPLSMFMSEVDRRKYPNVRVKYRFTQIDENGDESGKNSVHIDGEPAINPLLEAFLDADSFEEKLDRFYDMKHEATKEMLGFVATSLDIELSGSEVEEQYDEILRCLKTMVKYECNRLRQ